MTTPPLDLPAIKSDAEDSLNTDPRFPGGGFGIYLNTTMLALIARVEQIDGEQDEWRSEIGRLTRERDEWESNATEESARVEAAEAKIAAVRKIVDNDGIEVDTREYGSMLAVNADDISVALEDAALDGTA